MVPATGPTFFAAQRQFGPIDFGDLALHTAGTYQEKPVPTVYDAYIVKKGVKEVKSFVGGYVMRCWQQIIITFRLFVWMSPTNWCFIVY